MAKKKRTRLEELLRASKKTLRFLLREDQATREEKDEIIDLLNSAIDTAEGPEFAANLATVTLVMTRGTHKALTEALVDRDDGSMEYGAFVQWVKNGVRITKQRIYTRLDIDHGHLRRLKLLLLTTRTKHSDRAFKRLADQIEREGLSKNPLAVLAELGL
jgi:hypothetical protein